MAIAQGELKGTETFIDSLTQSVQVLLVFFTPKEGLTSVLTISADMSGASNVEVEFELKHYGILEEDNLTWYLAIQSIVLFNVSIMMLDALFSVIGTIRTGAMDMMVVIESITDLLCGTLVIVYIILRFPAQISSAQTVKDILGVLDDIPWASPDVPLVEKKTTFFDNVGLLLEKISWSETLNNLCNAILLVNLLRVIMCTSVHPRLALLTGTISNAMVSICTGLLACCCLLQRLHRARGRACMCVLPSRLHDDGSMPEMSTTCLRLAIRMHSHDSGVGLAAG